MSQHRRFPLVLGLFAVLLMLPSLGSGLFQDDLIHRAHLLKDSGLPLRYYGTPLVPHDSGTAAGAMRDMFAVTRSSEDVRSLMEQGLFPWWTCDRLRLSNWRPLTALTHWLDYRLFPDPFERSAASETHSRARLRVSKCCTSTRKNGHIAANRKK